MWTSGKRKHEKESKEIIIIEETFIIIEGEPWYHHSHRKQKVQLILTTLINNFKLKIMSVQLASNQFAIGIPALIDSDTTNPISATFSNPSFSSTNESVFGVTQDASDPNSPRVTGVAAGTGQLNVNYTVSYTDGNTGQPVTQSLSLSIDVTVTEVAGENVTLQVNFGAPQNQ